MNLPHLPPVLFAKEICIVDEGKASVRCEFPSLPTLPMFVEAAAQASSALLSSNIAKNGFLVVVKDTSLHVKASIATCVVVLEAHLSLGSASEVYFEAYQDEDFNIKVASGSLTVIIEGI